MAESTDRLPIIAHRAPEIDDRLTIADLARQLAPRMDRSLIQRYDANEDLRRILQKTGATYPAWTLSYWQAIADARQVTPEMVRPATAAHFVRAMMAQASPEPMTDNRSPATGVIAPRPDEIAVVAARTTLEIKPSAVSPADLARIQGRAQGLAMTERVLTAGQAAELLCISVPLLRRSIAPYRRFGNSPAGDRWRLSDLVEVD